MNSKNVYCYDPSTKEFVFSDIAFEDELEQGNYLFPPDCTEEIPPSVKEFEIQVWEEDKWIVKKDYRKAVVYDENNNIVRITEIGDLPEGFSLERHPDPEPTQKEIIKQYKDAIQDYMDSKAQLPEYDYDDLRSAISYENDINPKYAAEGAAFKKWRSQVWTYSLEQLNKALSGEIEIPTIEDFIQSLPELQIDYENV